MITPEFLEKYEAFHFGATYITSPSDRGKVLFIFPENINVNFFGAFE